VVGQPPQLLRRRLTVEKDIYEDIEKENAATAGRAADTAEFEKRLCLG
jgi:hypothetical protein